MKEILKNIAQFIFPETCHICGNRLNGNIHYLCPSCLSDLPRSLYHRLPFNPMEERFVGKFRFERANAHLHYSPSSSVATLMKDLKYHQFKGLAKYLGEIAGRELFTTDFFYGIDYIVPVPMHFIKRAKRGYNQAEVIAEGVSEITGIRIGNFLKATRSHKTQTKRTVEERRQNLKGIFSVSSSVDLNGRHLLILDDVCTTGTTITEAAQTILAAYPNARLSILTIGVT